MHHKSNGSEVFPGLGGFYTSSRFVRLLFIFFWLYLFFRPSHPSAQFIKMHHKSNGSEVFPGLGGFYTSSRLVRLLCISYLEMPSSVKTICPTTVWQSTEDLQPTLSLVPLPIPPARHAMR